MKCVAVVFFFQLKQITASSTALGGLVEARIPGSHSAFAGVKYFVPHHDFHIGMRYRPGSMVQFILGLQSPQ